MEKDKYPPITVAILNYNGSQYLKRTIPKLLGLDYPNYEILVVDNNSDDNSLSYLNRFKRIKVIKNKSNFGYSKGKNIAVKHSKGIFVLLLDNDILVEEINILKSLLKFYERFEDVSFLSLLMVDKGKTKTKYFGIYYSLYGMNVHRRLIDYRQIMKFHFNVKVGSFNGGAVFFKKIVWEELGGYDDLQPIMLDDFDISARSHIFGYSCYLYNMSVVTHLGKERDSNKKYFAWKFKYYFSGISTMMFKNYNFYDLIIRFPLFFLSSLAMMLAIIVSKRNIYVLYSFVYSYYFFINNLGIILSKRRKIQGMRKMKGDSFLDISPPSID